MPKERRLDIDIAKGIAIVLVVWGHILLNTIGKYSYFISLVHMPVFYFISGFFLIKELNNNSFKEITQKKVVRLLVPYVIWSLISFVVNIGMIFIRLKEISIEIIWNEAFDIFVYSRSVWFLVELFIAIEIIALSYFISEKLFGIIAIVIYSILFLLPINDYFAFYKYKWLFVFILVGVLAGKCDIEKASKKIKMVVGSIAILILVGAACYFGFLTDTYVDAFRNISILNIDLSQIILCVAEVVFGFIGIIAVVAIAKLLNKTFIKKEMAMIGYYSLDIYVIHMFLIYIFKAIPTFNLSFSLLAIIYLFVAIVVSLGIAILSKFILRKISIYRLSIGVQKNK